MARAQLLIRLLQFRLSSLLWLVTVIAVALGLWGLGVRHGHQSVRSALRQEASEILRDLEGRDRKVGALMQLAGQYGRDEPAGLSLGFVLEHLRTRLEQDQTEIAQLQVQLRQSEADCATLKQLLKSKPEKTHGTP